ncbi:MAG TPA: PKD domain-containing protein [Actinopolymorphaceae bacterium]
MSADPVNWTPHILDGHVKAIVQAGDTVIVGGAFTQVSSADGNTIYNRSNIVAFNATTGAVSTTFVPQVDDEVTSLALAPDGKSVFIGGFFDTVNGQPRKSLAKLNLSDGQLTSGFTTPKLTGRVKDLKLVKGRLWVAGTFTHVAGKAIPALATLNPSTGAVDTFQSVLFEGPRTNGTLQVLKIDATPDGTRLVAIGDFVRVGGEPREQIAMLDIGGSKATVANWRTRFYEATCSSSFPTYMRDVDISPDGSYFVVVTTGGYGGGPPKPCDTSARFQTGVSGTDIAPVWVAYTGGDTHYSVAVTGTAVYVGGHFRWQNNPHGPADTAGPGAVERSGIAALDPVNGMPLRWNPGRTRGVGVFDMLATSTGLWVGSDTDRIGNFEYHGRIAYFPLAGGTTVPRPATASLPTDVYLVPTGTNPVPRKRSFDGTHVGSTTTAPAGNLAWSNVRSAFMLGDELFIAWNDGTFNRRSFDGSAYGSPTTIDASDQLVRDSAWHADVAAATGMFFLDGKIYYTRSGSSTLYARYYTRESDTVGAQRFSVSGSLTGLSFGAVSGMFYADGKLYVASSADGNLRRVDFTDGKPVPGTVAVVSGPTVDGNDWRARTVFPFVDPEAGAGSPPTAELSYTCQGLTCTFSSVGSTDEDGTITSYKWTFGDGATATSAAPTHTYDQPGTYTVTLTVTDNSGKTGTKSAEITVTDATELAAKFSVSCEGLECSVDGRSSTDPSGGITSYEWTFGDGATATGATASHTYALPGRYPITLTVTGHDGQTAELTQHVSVAAPTSSVRFVAQAGSNRNATTHRVTIPTDVAAGDRLLLFFSVNSTQVTVSGPSGVTGWTSVGTKADSGMVTHVWQKEASPTDAGSTVEITLSGYAKADMAVVAYRGPDVTVRAHQAVVESTSRPDHTTPTVQGVDGGWLVSYWADKSSATTSWTAPAGEVIRRTEAGTGSGRITVLLTDGGSAAGTGTKGGLTATADAASGNATMWSIVIGPGG